MLSNKKQEDFHTFVAKGLFASKRAHPDIQPTIAVLTTRVKGPTDGDWKKLMRLMKYLNGTQDMVLTLAANDLHVVKWYVDMSYAVYPNFKSHTGYYALRKQGKQNVNTASNHNL